MQLDLESVTIIAYSFCTYVINFQKHDHVPTSLTKCSVEYVQRSMSSGRLLQATDQPHKNARLLSCSFVLVMMTLSGICAMR